MTDWNLSCPDWRERLRAGRSLVPDLPIDRAAGDRAVAVLNRLRLFDVPGTPTMGEAGGEWFREIVRALFGSLDPVTKARLIRELFVLVPKKQNKTTGGALLMLTALLLNERPRAPMLLTGPVQKTADDAFAAIEGAVALDNVLHKKLHVRDHLKLIVHRESQAKLEIMTFDPDVITGKKVVAALVDEEHVLGRMSKAKKAMVQLRGGMLPFPEAFLAIITTQSDEPPAGVFLEDLNRARDIRDGKRSGRMLPVLYEFPEEMQTAPAAPWRDVANWPMVMPNLGLSIQLDQLRDSFETEVANGDAALRVWASQHLNVQIGVALGSNAWAGAKFWERQAAPQRCSLEAILRNCEVVEVGIDGGGLDDLLGLCVMGRCRETGHWLAWFHAWAHPEVLERRKEVAPRLKDFEADGDLTMVERVDDDVDQAVAIVMRCEAAGLLDKIGVDAVGIGKIFDALIESDIEADRIKAIGQGWQMNGAIKDCERALAGRTLFHNGSRLMNWCVGNARIEQTGNAVKITKQVSGSAKIDPLIGGFNCATLLARAPSVGRSFWDQPAAA